MTCFNWLLPKSHILALAAQLRPLTGQPTDLLHHLLAAAKIR
jgi:hypothetical protein